ncbi:MAG: DinB family protein [Bacteroidota bacterium]
MEKPVQNRFAITLQNRKNLLYLLEKTPKDQLVCIPRGYRNNIWWNIAHVVVTQQLLVYGLSGLPFHVSDELVGGFRKGTVPDGTATDGEIHTVKSLLLPTTQQVEEDYLNGKFQTFREYTTSAKVTLKNVEDAITFNLFHEGLHMGTIFALQKAIRQEG